MPTVAVCILTAVGALLAAPDVHGQQQAPADTARADTARVIPSRVDTVFVERQPRKSPVVAGVLSGLLLVGSGQFYNGQPGKGFLAIGGIGGGGGLLLASVADNTCNSGFLFFCNDVEDEAGNDWLGSVGMLVMVGSYVYSVVDAVLSAQRINERIKAERQRTAERSLRVAPVYAGSQPGARLTLSF